jgi:hypothetical protein
MKLCTPGGDLGDCNKGDHCEDDDDCAPGLYCDAIDGICCPENGDC